jgi:anti-anti-sigma factor
MMGDTDDRIPIVVALSGRLDAAASSGVRRTLDGAVNSETPLVLVNMSGVSYISSASLRALLVAHKQAQSSGGRMVICCLQPQVAVVLHRVGFDQVLHLVETEAEAQQSLRSTHPPAAPRKGQP